LAEPRTEKYVKKFKKYVILIRCPAFPTKLGAGRTVVAPWHIPLYGTPFVIVKKFSSSFAITYLSDHASIN
jgi:hypothetical protein